MALKEEALSVKKRRRSNKWRENELGVEQASRRGTIRVLWGENAERHYNY